MRVTTVELHQKLGQTIDQARIEPVVLTEHDREHVVILSAQYYKSLLRTARKARHIETLTDAEVAALTVAEVPPEAEQRRILAQFEAATTAVVKP